MKWCLTCFKPSTSVDRFEAETVLAIQVSQLEAEEQEAKQLDLVIQEAELLDLAIQEAEQLDLAIQESSLILREQEESSLILREQEQEEERRRTREIEKDAQIANGLLYQEREKQINNKTALEEEEEEDEQRTKAVKKSLKEKGKRKQLEDDQVENDKQHALMLQENLNTVESPSRFGENNNISTRAPMDEDEQRVIWESLTGNGKRKQSKDGVEEDGKLPKVNPPPSMCGSCNSVIEHGRSVNVSGVLWHPECLICHACDKPIAIQEVENYVSNSRGNFHKSCYDRYCYICKGKVRNFGKHPFWKELYCLSHDTDGTHKCCSCERLEPKGTNYVTLGDGRWLCLECMESAVMDSDECQPLHCEMREFFEGLHMKIDKQFPFLLVEKQALNKAEKEEKIDYQDEVVTRGICLSEAQPVKRVSKGPRMGPNKQLIGMDTESKWVVSECEVTAILILYGLPRLLTGYILAHEMMHAYLRLNGYRNLGKVLEEGLCQLLGYRWLESQTYATVDADATAASSSSSPTSVANVSKKGESSDFEKKLVEFCKNQIETDESQDYGDGFRRVNKMMPNSSPREILKEILRRI